MRGARSWDVGFKQTRRRSLLAPQERRVLAMLKDGLKPDEIADELIISNAHMGTLLSRLRRARERGQIDIDIPFRKNGRPGDIRARVERLTLKNLEGWVIAERIGRSPRYVYVVQWQLRKEGRLPPLRVKTARAA